MEKKTGLLIIAVVLLAIVILFVVQEEPKDTDGDGCPDDIDDFPNDPDFHEKSFDVLENATSPFNITQDWSVHGYVESDWKYVTTSWQIISPSNFTTDEFQNMRLVIRIIGNLPGPKQLRAEYEYNYSIDNENEVILPVNSTSTEEWVWMFIDYGLQRVVTTNVEIYKIR